MSDRFGSSRAGFGQRLGALLADWVILGIAGWLVGLAFGQSVVTISDGLVAYGLSGTPAAIMFFVNLAYFGGLEGGPSGATFGKRFVGIKVVDSTSGEAIGYGRGVLRWISRLLSALPLALGYFWMLGDPEKQTWHDKLSRSVVIEGNPVAAASGPPF